mgnify:CR=1 FL=1
MVGAAGAIGVFSKTPTRAHELEPPQIFELWKQPRG